MNNTHVSISSQNNLLLINPVVVGGFSQNNPHNNLQKRKEIRSFSASSACRMRRFLRTCRADYKSFITLTYPYKYPIDGKISKEHLRKFMQELKRYVERNLNDKSLVKLFSAFWFMEFQSRGAIHYHIFCTDFISKTFIAETWYRIVNSEDKRHLVAGTSIEKIRAGRSGTCAYASKYAAKSEQKEIPEEISNAGRFWGVCGDRVAVAAATIVKASGENSPRVELLLGKLKELIKVLVNKGELVKLDSKGRSHSVFHSKTNEAMMKINQLVLRLEVVNMFDGVQPTYWLPHHEENIYDFEVL